MTRIKILLARGLYCILHLFLRRDIQRVRRGNVEYELDLSEGIDLSLFLFGNFQGHVIGKNLFKLPEEAIIFDVGANIGSMSLQFAQIVPKGHVYAFEPTNYAYAKLIRNLALNRELARRISPVQSFVSDRTEANPQLNAYASWKVDNSPHRKHPLHGGIIKSAESIPSVTLDDFCLEQDIDRVELIKIDTDGHEFSVLEGACKTIEKFRPYIIFEAGLYVFAERGVEFKQYMEFFTAYNYSLIDSKNGRKVSLKNYHQRIPQRSTTDIIAIPPNAV